MSPSLLALSLMYSQDPIDELLCCEDALTCDQLVGHQTIESLGKAISNVVWPWPVLRYRVFLSRWILVSWFPPSSHQSSERGFLPPPLKGWRRRVPSVFDRSLQSHVVMLHAIQVSPGNSVSAHTKEEQVWVTEKPWRHLHKSVWKTDMESSKLS